MRLRLWSRAIFVDWHGVLSDQPFWHTILENDRHPLHERLQTAADSLFHKYHDLVVDWMRGRLSSTDVLDVLDVRLDRRFREDFLARRLRDDCRQMTPMAPLLKALTEVPAFTFVAVATDNMDCFIQSARHIRGLQPVVDDFLCSSELGVLKAENPERFFGPRLEQLCLGADQALLIDDSAQNCQAFDRWGGHAIHHTCLDRTLRQLAAWLDQQS